MNDSSAATKYPISIFTWNILAQSLSAESEPDYSCGKFKGPCCFISRFEKIVEFFYLAKKRANSKLHDVVVLNEFDESFSSNSGDGCGGISGVGGVNMAIKCLYEDYMIFYAPKPTSVSPSTIEPRHGVLILVLKRETSPEGQVTRKITVDFSYINSMTKYAADNQIAYFLNLKIHTVDRNETPPKILNIILVGAHLKSGNTAPRKKSRNHQLAEIYKKLCEVGSDLSTDKFIIVGDLNSGHIMQDADKTFTDNMVNVHEYFNLKKGLAGKSFNSAIRTQAAKDEAGEQLDYILVSKNLVKEIHQPNCAAEITPHNGKIFENLSDHYPLDFNFLI